MFLKAMHIQHKVGLVAIVPCVIFAATVAAQATSPRAVLAFVPRTSGPAGVVALAAADATGWPVQTLFRALVVLALLLLAAAAWWATHPRRVRSGTSDFMLLSAQVALSLFAHTDLLYFIAMEAAYLLGWRRARGWLLAIVAGTLAARLPFATGMVGPASLNITPTALLASLLGQSLMQVLGAGVGHLIKAEQDGRRQVALAHAELLATQQLLGEAIRASERVRIAHDLHDTIGHHLTALSLNLQLAVLQQGRAQTDSLHSAQGLARTLMEEVRAVVAAQRRQEVDWRSALATLCQAIPRPEVALAIDERTRIASPAVAQALFFAVREAVTNAVRHAQATRVEIAVGAEGGTLKASIVDNGRGAPGGADTDVRSIRERVAAAGGSVQVRNRAEGGFAVSITIPGGAT